MLKRVDAEQAVKLILDSIGTALTQGRRVQIRGFGSFWAQNRNALVTRNPRTGKLMQIKKRSLPRFRAAEELSDKLKGGNFKINLVETGKIQSSYRKSNSDLHVS